jgi:hypothetical protein
MVALHVCSDSGPRLHKCPSKSGKVLICGKCSSLAYEIDHEQIEAKVSMVS